MPIEELRNQLRSFYPPLAERSSFHPAGYFNYVRAACRQSVLLMVRRQRLILAAVVALLPVIVPVATAFLSRSPFAAEGGMMMEKLAEMMHVNLIAPLLALFFATMLVGEEIEGQTLVYLLTRPAPKSAWIFGRFLGYVFVASLILTTSIMLTFLACTALADFPISSVNLILTARYAVAGMAAIAAYGALMMWLGAITRRPIVLGVVLLYGWEKAANVVPGIVDFFTIQKFTHALLPALGAGVSVETAEVIQGWEREVYYVDATKAAAILAVITVCFLAATVWAVRGREFHPARTLS